ncbi:Proteasome subunit beta type [Rhynchospora pubera]|uniref:Proteasome subunit beta type n=2 Tax=Rhynchospora pubera TaxID=906938 RepID=A0AAV8G4E0_9POAL|nr:Proteasome subunit beta type [Rhynchospora pubera]
MYKLIIKINVVGKLGRVWIAYMPTQLVWDKRFFVVFGQNASRCSKQVASPKSHGGEKLIRCLVIGSACSHSHPLPYLEKKKVYFLARSISLLSSLSFPLALSSPTNHLYSLAAMSIFEYNGSALVAMVGKNCFAIASDRRLGVQLQTVATDFQRVFKIHDRLYIGLSGLATDAQTMYQKLVFRHKLYQLREERDMKPQTFASLVSALLYEKRFGPFFCQPVIAGLGDNDEPFICTMDCLGAKELAKDFVVSGTASESLYGACESMYKPDMEPEELFETISQALLSSVDRDCLSGWGGYVLLVYAALLTPTEVQEKILKGRMD